MYLCLCVHMCMQSERENAYVSKHQNIYCIYIYSSCIIHSVKMCKYVYVYGAE